MVDIKSNGIFQFTIPVKRSELLQWENYIEPRGEGGRGSLSLLKVKTYMYLAHIKINNDPLPLTPGKSFGNCACLKWIISEEQNWIIEHILSYKTYTKGSETSPTTYEFFSLKCKKKVI